MPETESAPSAEKLRIVRARSKRAVEEFVEFPYRLHAAEAHWVPPLRRDVRVLLDRMRHPFHEHAQVEYFLARQGGKTVGRIAAVENHAHNMAHDERVGFFGFFETIDDTEVVRALLGAAERWCRERGLEAMRGPCSFSTNEECGLLVENYDSMPCLMMCYHPPYYKDRIEENGYTRAEDLLCFWIRVDGFTNRVERIADAATRRLERGGKTLTMRTLDVQRWDDELALVKRLYNKAWEKNWGFVPMTEREMNFVAKELRPIIEPELVYFAELDGEPVGFTLAMPDYNVVLQHMNGRLGPKEILLALMLRKNIKHLRLLMMGMLPEYRNRGIDLLMCREAAARARKLSLEGGELGWVLDRNEPMKHAIEACGGRMYRKYRIYEKRIKDKG